MTAVVQNSPSVSAAERAIQKIVLPGQTPEGEHIFGVLVKRTYDVVPGGRCTRAAVDKKLVSGDVHYDDLMNSTVKFESDFIPFKLATDVVLNGRAHAPRGQRVATLTASLVIGQHCKEVLVFGDRLASYNGKRDPVFTEPQPFESMGLRYERAYGGVDIFSEPKMQCIYPRNHLGRGYVVANTKRSVEQLPLPNIEDPDDLLTPQRLCVGDFRKWEHQPMPQGFGWTMKMWRPRSSYAGIMPADRTLEQELRAAYSALVPPAQRKLYEQTHLPTMDFRFFNGASAGLVLPFLSGVGSSPQSRCAGRYTASITWRTAPHWPRHRAWHARARSLSAYRIHSYGRSASGLSLARSSPIPGAGLAAGNEKDGGLDRVNACCALSLSGRAGWESGPLRAPMQVAIICWRFPLLWDHQIGLEKGRR